MLTWEGLEEENDEEEANLALMASTSSDAESEVDYEDEDEVFFELTREDLFNVVKKIISHYHNKSKGFKILKGQYDLMTN